MKNRFFQGFLTLLMAFAFTFSAISQTYNTPTLAKEGASYARYTGTVDMTADGDSIASHYTKAFFIGNSNQGLATLTVNVPNVTGTEDINVFLELSNDLTNWKAISAAVHDQVTAGTTYDTLSTVNGTSLFEFKSSIFARLHFDGQSGNPINTITWQVYIPKNTGAPPTNATYVESSL